MELKIEHLKGYFGTNLQVQINKKTYPSWIGVKELTLETLIIYRGKRNKIKPILRPLSDLTKEDINSFSVDVRLALREFNSEKLLSRACYYELKWLLENHFDIHGLIDQNLAINIKTLKDEI